MAASSFLPEFQSFNVNAEPTSLSIEWNKWISRFENLVVALGITDDGRKKALLLYYGGKDVHDIYNTLTPVKAEVETLAAEDYTDAKQNLTTYFTPSKNETFEVYNFRSLKQKEGEAIDKYVTRLKDAAARCGFHDVSKEIKHQIVFSCSSKKVRRKALSDDPTLDDLMKYARATEKTIIQAEIIEGQEKSVNRLSKPGKYSKRNKGSSQKKKAEKPPSSKSVDCYFCGERYPHKNGRESCPAWGKICTKCDRPNHLAKKCKDQKVRQIAENNQSSTESSSEEEYCYAVDGKKRNSKNAKIEMNLENRKVTFQIDTGSSVNVINEAVYRRLKTNAALKKSKTRLYPYGSKVPLPIVGYFNGVLETQKRIKTARVYVCEGDNVESLLGLETAVDLEVIHIVNSISQGLPQNLRKIVEKHQSRFEGVGLMKNVQVKLDIDPDVKPVANKHRRIPFHLRPKVEAETNRLLAAGLVEPVTEPSDWVSPVVLTNKEDGGIRLCVDMTEPNKAIRRVRHVMPTIDDIKYQVNGAKIFSKVDLTNGYHQLELKKCSRNITTFSTHKGIFRFRRLNFGTNSASEIFHNEIEKLVSNIRGALNIQDDILIFGKTQNEHDQALSEVLDALEGANLTLKKSKCSFNKQSIKFYGLIFSPDGISPDPEKIDALQHAEPPTSKTELRSFLGMANYSAEFIKDYAMLTSDLRKLTHKNEKWEWQSHHQHAFDKLKTAMGDHTMLSYFDPNWDTKVVCDGSPFGVAGILMQTNPETKKKKIIAYASRSLTDAETRYGQIEREALSIHFSCLKFQLYLLGKPFEIITDHKPLVYMFNNPKSQTPYRIERIRMKLQGFAFKVIHIPGPTNPTDYISRKPLCIDSMNKRESKKLEKHVYSVISEGIPGAVTLDDIKTHTQKDEESKHLFESIKQGYIDKKAHPDVKKYQRVFQSLSICDGIILKGHKIVVPCSLRKRIIEAGHDGHQGIVKTKTLLRSKVWYPGIDDDATKIVSSCRGCQSAVNDNSREPVIMSELPNAPWESIITDFYGPTSTGEYLISVIDEYSRFPIVKIVTSTSPKAAIPKYDEIFSEFGIPQTVRSDNGSPYNSHEFKDFAKYMGFTHDPSMPCYPQANGMVEKFNVNFTKIRMIAKVEKKNWKQELFKFLRNYRTTPHSTTGETPASLLFSSRKFRTRIPEMPLKLDDISIRSRDKKNKMTIKKYADRKRNVKACPIKVGDAVLVKKPRKSKSDPYYDPTPYVVTKRKGNMIVARRHDHVITRNTSFFKIVENDNSHEITSNESDYESDSITSNAAAVAVPPTRNENDVEPVLRRSTRMSVPPVRYPAGVNT